MKLLTAIRFAVFLGKMRFNKNEMITVAQHPAPKFDKEGPLIIWEKQEGFFKRAEKQGLTKKRKSKSLQEFSCYGGTNKASIERWCRLRGNLLFYTKTKDPLSEPVGVIVLLHHAVKADQSPIDGTFGFSLIFDNGLTQNFATFNEHERDSWLEAIQANNYDHVRATLISLQQQLELKQNHDPDMDIQMWRIRKGHHSLDIIELPLCEVSLACDNLLCDGNGIPPRSCLVIHVYFPNEDVWLKYGNTEIIDKCSNPVFLKTVCFWPSDGINEGTFIRISAHDVKEKFSGLSTPIGSAKFYLSTLLDCQTKTRVPLLSSVNSVAGFLSLNIWRHEREKNSSAESTPSRSLHHTTILNVPCHRRTQSLPSRFNVKQKLPQLNSMQRFFANALLSTYRFHSGLGGDISVHEIMAESKIGFLIPQQLLEVWMGEEKELLQEVAGMGELVEPWNNRQLEVLDRHLQLLHMYSQAKEFLKSFKSGYFKPSARSKDRSLEFAPVNLHLQRIWVQNDSLKKSGFYDVITVGAFTKHSQRKSGGLIKLIQQLKESPVVNGTSTMSSSKISLAYDAIQAIKVLRQEVVDGMKTLVKFAKKKQSFGMLPICEQMISKTKILLSLWDPDMVKEALNFIEENKVTRSGKFDPPLRKIAQQISLRSRRVDDEDSIMSPDESSSDHSKMWSISTSSSSASLQNESNDSKSTETELLMNFSMNDDVSINHQQLHDNELNNDVDSNEKITKNSENSVDDSDIEDVKNSDLFKLFLDSHTMSTSPSANYYKPTDEPEPFDLTQLNIEASVMCLVSKVKFLCGRCGSPSIRLRNHKSINKSRFKTSSITSGTSPQGVTRSNSILSPNNVTTLSASEVNESFQSQSLITTRNKFTEGLDFDSLDDWMLELQPSMQKLRQAMDGLLKTARLTHSVFRIQEDRRVAQNACKIRYRRHVCFSQALTALVTGLMAKLWCQKVDSLFLHILMTVGPLAEFEGLVSLYGDEIDMWGDMVVAVEDLSTVNFILVPSKSKNEEIIPQVIGCRSNLDVMLPVPESVFTVMPLSKSKNHSFRVTPVFFNIGINEYATLVENLCMTKPQHQSNIDNFDKLNEYFHRFKKIDWHSIDDVLHKTNNAPNASSLVTLMDKLKISIHTTKQKNVEVLHLAQKICRKMKGIRFTSCKSAKDRTGMSVTLEQTEILSSEYDLAEHEYERSLDTMRAEGVRRENTFKNIGVKKYRFNAVQISSYPKYYKPPSGTYGNVQR